MIEVKVPSVGESVTQGVLASWSVPDGAYVKKGDTLFELETDKASAEVPAPEAGIVRHRAQPGDEVQVGAVVAVIEASAGAPAAVAAAPQQAPAAAKPPAPSVAMAEPSRVSATSVARKMAEDGGLDLAGVKGTGTHGRITREDVEAALSVRGTPAPPASPSVPAPVTVPVSTTASGNGSGETTRERMSMMRRRIAERLVEAQQTAAMLTTFNDVDMSAIIALRKQYKEPFEKKHGVGLGFMSFFVKACVEALGAFPRVNAMIDGTDFVLFHKMHIGVAVSTPKGLVVPVIRNAQDLSFAGVEQVIADFGKRGRENKIDLDELQGGTFTISNGGIFGSMLSTPILNPPQSAILGMHRIEDRPVARDGQVVIRPMMYLALSYDHRIIDGREAVGFLVRVKECLENPARMMLGV